MNQTNVVSMRARNDASLVVDAELIGRHGGNGPRYTSYPTADRFVEEFSTDAYRRWLGIRTIGGFSRPLGLYVHVPFCDTLCFYCACNKIVTRDRAKAVKYVAGLQREMALVASALAPSDRRLTSMHWGGGTPTFLDEEQAACLMDSIRSTFGMAPGGECAIEIDPRRADGARVRSLARLGFNRISLGVQDFDPPVQQAVHRLQSVAQTREAIDAARESGFRSVNIDLIYGLPKQTREGFARTLAQVVECDPDRIALYSYAHLPSAFKPQRRILEEDLPLPQVKLDLLADAIRVLGDAGYTYIGMDHFAKPGDDLAIAQRQGRLARDFQGYTSGGDSDLVGLGASAIGRLGPVYAQNVKGLDDYYAALDAGRLPTWRGIQLTADDLVRRAVIQALACHFALAKESIAIAHLIDFDRYFETEMRDLERLADDGLVEFDRDWIYVTPRGRLLVRAVCMVFDRYLRATRERSRYSRVV